MQRDTTTHHDATLASYDERLAHDIAQRERDANVAQRERDARRDAYDNALASTPITLALRERYLARSDYANRAFVPPPPRVYKPTRMPRGPNAWERNDVHVHTHKPSDKSCHHPLVKCAHKW